ncbi:MAG: hypothetical protein [Alternaria alternata deltaflexivirus 1]|nr:MAG: hypothetical protein [Alternaria alternata deltaflexivirus 1]
MWKRTSIAIERLLPMFLLSFPDEYILKANLGDSRHRHELVDFFQNIHAAEPFLTNSHQATYIRTRYPALVPPPQNGVPANNHTLGTIFEYNYECYIEFRARYITFIADNPGFAEPHSA